MEIVCLDLEGVLVPEIWIAVAERTGISDLSITTRDVSDYDALMGRRLETLRTHGLGLSDIQAAVDGMVPLEGAEAFLMRLRERFQVVILSDTFYEFVQPLMRRLGWPTLFCHSLETDAEGSLAGYRPRTEDHKRRTVAALKGLNFVVMAAGDSYNDTGMLNEADAGVLFRAPEDVVREFPHFPRGP